MPLLLVILDGWGIAPPSKENAITQAKTPTWNRLTKEYPSCRLEASAPAVGLPEKTIGNSEVGHMNIGAGRVVYQDLTRINAAIRDKNFFKNRVLSEAVQKIKKAGGVWHLMGLLSDGGVHSHLDHLLALLEFARQQNVSEVFIHCFMDGRDTPPNAGKGYLAKLGKAPIATVMGRYYAMDRDKRWERTELAYQAMVSGEGKKFASALEGIEASYAKGITDEFVLPFVVNNRPVREGDGICFFNFRADRARQITEALHGKEAPKLSSYITMTRYDKNYPYLPIFPPQNLDNVLGKVISDAGLKQFRIAETEKYAHVTYFFNGGQEAEFPGEERKLIPSPRDVATYDLKPEMSALEVTEEVLRRLDSKKYDVVIMNLANPDMVGHSGDVAATIKAVETADRCLGKILAKLESLGGQAIVTSDHGNAEGAQTAHTLNPVPLVLFGPGMKGKKLRSGGKLCDIAPTLLQLLGIPKPKEMTGRSLCSD
ncbi:MAG: 2,3-bisphosphoglycerate-independent phosphoglycerate mutase [Deltaproteobacteria bacterium]|nr:2,3-bisphosphoglycerate-independent phosphoglycerate mutase [Deltaproteobacteria bacterium]